MGGGNEAWKEKNIRQVNKGKESQLPRKTLEDKKANLKKE